MARKPRHLVDFFLAGAAGHRISDAWTVLEEDYGPGVRKLMAGFPTGNISVEDLWAEKLTDLLEEEPEWPRREGSQQPAKIVRYRGLASLLSYLFTSLRRKAIDLNRSTRVHETLDPLDRLDPSSRSPDDIVQRKETLARFCQAFLRAFKGLSTEQRFLILMVYRTGMKKKTAGALLNWPDYKVARELARAQTELLNGLADLKIIEQKSGFSDLWEAAWQGLWKRIHPSEAGKPMPQEAAQ